MKFCVRCGKQDAECRPLQLQSPPDNGDDFHQVLMLCTGCESRLMSILSLFLAHVETIEIFDMGPIACG